MSKQNVGRMCSTFVTNDKLLGAQCSQRNHRWCKGKVRIKNKDEKLNEITVELKQKYQFLSEKAIKEEALIVLRKSSLCECFCHTRRLENESD